MPHNLIYRDIIMIITHWFEMCDIISDYKNVWPRGKTKLKCKNICPMFDVLKCTWTGISTWSPLLAKVVENWRFTTKLKRRGIFEAMVLRKVSLKGCKWKLLPCSCVSSLSFVWRSGNQFILLRHFVPLILFSYLNLRNMSPHYWNGHIQ